MFAFPALALLLGASSALSQRKCGTFDNYDGLAEAEAHFQSNKFSLKPRAYVYAHVLRVFWHVVSKDETPAGGNIPEKRITDSMQVLVNDYQHTGISWILANITRTVNASWFDDVAPGLPISTTMKTALHQGSAADLNVYTTGFKSDFDEVGFSSWPSDYVKRPKEDGVVLNYATVPGGTHAPFNLGRSLTHEVGHWCGLSHTYHGGCFGGGNFVSVTPPEAPGAAGCPAQRDTCPGGGVDPIHNFMDSTDDSCATEFTPGQIARLRQRLAKFRGLAA